VNLPIFVFVVFIHHSTHDPPHKQWLMGLGVGGVSFIVRVIVIVVGV
jgi:hypothetical protein